MKANDRRSLLEITKLDTGQLIEVLNINGLADCAEAMRTKEIDGESFLNLSETQIILWKNILNRTQMTRLWSVIQFAKENPSAFYIPITQISSTPTKRANSSNSTTEWTNSIKENSLKDNPQELYLNLPASSTENQRFGSDQETVTKENTAKNMFERSDSNDTIPKEFYLNLPPPPKVNFQNRTNERANIVKTNTVSRNNSFRGNNTGKNTTEMVYSNLPAYQTESSKVLFKPVPINVVKPNNENEGRNTSEKMIKNESTLHTLIQKKNSDIFSKLNAVIANNPFPQNPNNSLKSIRSGSNTSLSSISSSRNSYDDYPRTNLSESNTGSTNSLNVETEQKNEPKKMLKSISSQRKDSRKDIANRPLPPLPTQNVLKPPDAQRLRSTSRSPEPIKLSASPTDNSRKLSLPTPPLLNFKLVGNISSDLSPTSNEDAFDDEYYSETQLTDYTKEPWYRDADRNTCETILKDKPNGSFLIRPSSQSQNLCILVVVYNNKIYNLPVRQESSGGLTIGTKRSDSKKTFTSVKQIVDFYTQNKFALNYQNTEVYCALCHFQ